MANALTYELIRAEAETATRSKNPAAIDLDMRWRAATFLWTQRLPTQDDVVAVRALFERALELDPKDAGALAGSALTYLYEYMSGRTNPEIDYDAKILERADRAIALARDSAYAYIVKSSFLNISLRPNDALRVANAGLALNSNNASLFAARAAAQNYLGQFEQAKSDLRQVVRLSPHDPRMSNWCNLVADAELGLGGFDAAIEECASAIDAGWRTIYS